MRRLFSSAPLIAARFMLVRKAQGRRVEQVVHVLPEVPVLVDGEHGQAGDGVEAADATRFQLSEGSLVLRTRLAWLAGSLFLGERGGGTTLPLPPSGPVDRGKRRENLGALNDQLISV
jgi:hypothetical protein